MEVQGLMADDTGSVLYLVVSGAPAPEGVPALVELLQAGGLAGSGLLHPVRHPVR